MTRLSLPPAVSADMDDPDTLAAPGATLALDYRTEYADASATLRRHLDAAGVQLDRLRLLAAELVAVAEPSPGWLGRAWAVVRETLDI